MKVQIIYTSLSGSTEKLARSLERGLEYDCTLQDIREGVDSFYADVILFGFYGISAMPNDEMCEVMKRCTGKPVGIFATLGYYAGSSHAWDTLKNGVDLVKERNEVLFSYICNGHIHKDLQKGYTPSHPTQQKHLRWEMLEKHPTENECCLLVEMAGERIALYRRAKEMGIAFHSIL